MPVPAHARLRMEDLPQSVREPCWSHTLWYRARNAEDGSRFRVPPWSVEGVHRRCRDVYLALGIWVGWQRGTADVGELTGELDDLRAQAEAGKALAEHQREITRVSALLLSEPDFSRADTAPIPTQRSSR